MPLLVDQFAVRITAAEARHHPSLDECHSSDLLMSFSFISTVMNAIFNRNWILIKQGDELGDR
jgi:hypothetical protein